MKEHGISIQSSDSELWGSVMNQQLTESKTTDGVGKGSKQKLDIVQFSEGGDTFLHVSQDCTNTWEILYQCILGEKTAKAHSQ